MQWISKHSQISPSYQVRWNALDASLNICFMKFHPKLEKSKINEIIHNLPFFIAPKLSYSSFSCEVFGFFVIPRIFLNDLINLVNKMEYEGYLIKKYLLKVNLNTYFHNLNYFRAYLKERNLINPSHWKYEKFYEIEFRMKYGQEFYQNNLSLLELLILDRIRFFSTNSFGFERRTKTLDELKSDSLDEIIYQRNLIDGIKKHAIQFFDNIRLRTDFLNFLDNNQLFNFFIIKKVLSNVVVALNLIKKTHSLNPKIRNLLQFQEHIKNKGVSQLIEENLLFKDKLLVRIINKDFLPIYYTSVKEFDRIIDKFTIYRDWINLCDNLKIFNLNSIKRLIKDPRNIDAIFKKKELKLKKKYETIKSRVLTSKEVEKKIDNFLTYNPPLIKPNLINTFTYTHISNFFPIFLLRNTEKSKEKINELKSFFPQIAIGESTDLFSKEEIIYVEVSSPYLNSEEKFQFYSMMFNNFKETVILGNRYFHSGYLPVFSMKSFYDLESKRFFYTKDLFNQFFDNVKQTLGGKIKISQTKSNDLQAKYWSREKNLINLSRAVNIRVSKEKQKLDIKHLNRLLKFHLNLKKYLLDVERFKKIKSKQFFDNYIKSIKFIPSFQHFGFSQYFLCLSPTSMNEIDFKILISNGFQRIKHPACIDSSTHLFIKYIIPYNEPNLKYLHWLTKSKRIIREYCGFSIKKVYQILHFDYNLTSDGWIFNYSRFKSHMENILFSQKNNFKNSNVEDFGTVEDSINSYFDPDSPEYKSLIQIYNWKSIDIKSYLGTKNLSTRNHINSLLKKDLIFPYLSLKNLDLFDKASIIIPNLKQELNETIVKIFSFFNLAFIYEIKGEYFIHGFDQEVKYQNGLMIKLYFPKCEISEFLRVFDLLFEYLEIENYIILNDLVDGKNLLKSIYGGLDFLKSYNPLKNLEWNQQKKRWVNPKVFTSKFEPIYPDLIPKDK
jgi:hypothetical protein